MYRGILGQQLLAVRLQRHALVPAETVTASKFRRGSDTDMGLIRWTRTPCH